MAAVLLLDSVSSASTIILRLRSGADTVTCPNDVGCFGNANQSTYLSLVEGNIGNFEVNQLTEVVGGTASLPLMDLQLFLRRPQALGR